MRSYKGYIMRKITTTADIGRAIRMERKAQGFTQIQLAELCGVGLTYLSNLENGKETAEIGKALRVARMLGFDFFLMKRGE